MTFISQILNNFFFFSKITINIEIVDDDTNEISFKKVVTSYYHGQMSGNQVIGLEPNTDYWVTVEMFNSAGLSNPSERQRLSTCLGGRNYFLLLWIHLNLWGGGLQIFCLLTKRKMKEINILFFGGINKRFKQVNVRNVYDLFQYIV